MREPMADGMQSKLEAALFGMLAKCQPGKSIDPAEVARLVGGTHPNGWGPLMKPLRRIAVRLAGAGRIVIVRKGREVDPADFKGVYRLSLPPQDAAGETGGPIGAAIYPSCD